VKKKVNKYGFEESAWEAAKNEAREILVRLAGQRARIPYSDLMPQIKSITLDYHDPRVAHFLGEISKEEDAADRSMLTAIVVHKTGDMQPGPGFYELAEELGRDTSDKLRCWVDEFNRVHDYWANKSTTRSSVTRISTKR
jgi:hypothetical protein